MYKIFDILCCNLLSYYMESYCDEYNTNLEYNSSDKYSDIENDYIIVMDM